MSPDAIGVRSPSCEHTPSASRHHYEVSMSNFPSTPTPTNLANRFIYSRADLVERGISFSDQWLLRMERDGKFPKRVAIGARRIGWVAAEVEAHLTEIASDIVRKRAAAERSAMVRPATKAAQEAA
jgi:predicted DNA-binding transcriptional regulator AlpA